MHSGLQGLPPRHWRPEGFRHGEKTRSDLFFKDAEDGLEQKTWRQGEQEADKTAIIQIHR